MRQEEHIRFQRLELLHRRTTSLEDALRHVVRGLGPCELGAIIIFDDEEKLQLADLEFSILVKLANAAQLHNRLSCNSMCVWISGDNCVQLVSVKEPDHPK